MYSLGVVHFDLNEFDDALKILNQFDVNYQNVAFYLGGCFFSSKNYSRAAQCFEIAYNKNSKDKILTYNYALALLNIFKYDKALPLFEQLKSVDVLPYAALHYARCLIEVGNKKTAKAEIDSLIKMSKNADVRKEALGLKKLC